MRQRKQVRKLNNRMRKKLVALFGLVLLALVGLTLRINYINAKSGDKYTKQVLTQSQQQYDSKILPYRRGDITDRNGTILATSNKVYNVILDCKVVNSHEDYREPTVDALVEILGLDKEDIEKRLDQETTRNSQYQILTKGISMDEKKSFEEYANVPDDEELSKEELKKRSNVQGVWFEDDYVRTYPFDSLACDVIGFTFAGNTADWGLEGYYNSTLNGVNGRQYGYFNEDADVEQTIIEAENGKNITTSLDVNIQQIIEKYIASFEEAMSDGPNEGGGAKNIGVIVADPNNGEILGMASSDPYDLNNPRDMSHLYEEEVLRAMNDEATLEALNEMWRNYCISDAFEPGSVVKPWIMASALEAGAVIESDVFVCDGGQQVADRFMKCAVYPDSHGTQALGEVIQNSCNDAMIQISKKMGAADFLKYQSAFNFGSRTGIDLPGEGTGIIYTEDTMNATELATSSFGQGFTCTMIQEMAAICTAINGGTYYQPHLVTKITDSQGKTIKNIEPVVMKEILSSDISASVREYMGMSVESGTGRSAKVTGYSMGGKTGTAQKIPRGNGKYLVSFIGFAPLDNPQVAIYVVVDEPNTDAQADSKYPQYIAQGILSEILPYMNIYPDQGEGTTELWYGFNGVKKQNDVSAEEETQEGEEDTEEDTGTQDGIEDTSVPGPPEEEEDETTQMGGNKEESDGITNEDAGLSDE